jgi:hypothetical protein
MGFDYVFAHRGHQYLAMETEKLDYFSGNQGIDRSYLPGRVYRSKERPDQDVPIRGQVPALPLGRAWRGASYGLFLYIDGEVRKPSGFDTYLLHSTEICSICSLGWTRSGWYTSQRTSLCFRRRRAFSRACAGGPAEERRQTASFDKRQLEQLSHELRGSEGRSTRFCSAIGSSRARGCFSTQWARRTTVGLVHNLTADY